MTNAPTPEQVDMARRISESTRVSGPLGKGPPNAEKAALAAIAETTELAAQLAERTYAKDAFSFVLGTEIATALRNNAHLRSPA